MLQNPIIVNSVEQIQIRAKQGKVPTAVPWLVLLLRISLLFFFGFAGTGVLMLLGYQDPLKEVIKWWGFQLILTNIVCFFVLKALAAKEKIMFRDLMGYNKATLKKSIIFVLITFIPSAVIAFGGMWGSQLLIYGNRALPVVPNQSLPIVAALIVLIFLPISNILIETTTYFGYSLQRLEAQGVNTALAVIIASFFLALQHIAFPMVFDPVYILYKLLSFLPASLVTGFVFSRVRQLPPLMAVQYFADGAAAIMIFIASLR